MRMIGKVACFQLYEAKKSVSPRESVNKSSASNEECRK